jgi:predicted GIY-YIG superfamily endonuclease
MGTPSKPQPNNGRTALYRHFGKSGRLLYVGVSLNAPARLAQHREHSHWFAEIERVEFEWYPSRSAALIAERNEKDKPLCKSTVSQTASG